MIYALSSAGGGPSAVAVIRLSGDDAIESLRQLLSEQALPETRRASVRSLYHPRGGDLLDRALVLVFRAPHSFTGEDMVELHVHGGRAVIKAVLRALATISGSRYAVAGEFSRRAYAHGRIDFTGAEGLADLINADTDAQRRLALRHAGGEAFRVFEDWCGRLSRWLAHAEACLDFSDEELPPHLQEDSLSAVAALAAEMRHHLMLTEKAERLRTGVHAAIVGPVNAGKSSLLNYFAAREAAIVSSMAGTTRDVIEVTLDMDGLPLILSDTAGFRTDAENEVEHEGIKRAQKLVHAAHMRLWVFDISACAEPPPCDLRPHDLLIFNKADKLKKLPAWMTDSRGYIISLSENKGLHELRRALSRHLHDLSDVAESAIVVRTRHAAIVTEVIAILETLSQNTPLEIAAEELRTALAAIGRITGRVSTEELLDIIFADFCIGK